MGERACATPLHPSFLVRSQSTSLLPFYCLSIISSLSLIHYLELLSDLFCYITDFFFHLTAEYGQHTFMLIVLSNGFVDMGTISFIDLIHVRPFKRIITSLRRIIGDWSKLMSLNNTGRKAGNVTVCKEMGIVVLVGFRPHQGWGKWTLDAHFSTFLSARKKNR